MFVVCVCGVRGAGVGAAAGGVHAKGEARPDGEDGAGQGGQGKGCAHGELVHREALERRLRRQDQEQGQGPAPGALPGARQRPVSPPHPPPSPLCPLSLSLHAALLACRLKDPPLGSAPGALPALLRARQQLDCVVATHIRIVRDALRGGRDVPAYGETLKP
eukprot:30022-Prorocentrum_minimum.AAC.3